MTPLKIVSGGQTGVDQAALDAARELGLPYGGFVPAGRWTEEGVLSEDYVGMVEIDGGPPARTKRNVRESDATLIITRGDCEGGTLLTLETARAAGKPCLVIDLARESHDDAAERIVEWLKRERPQVLNVAGPRSSKRPGLYMHSKWILIEALERL